MLHFSWDVFLTYTSVFNRNFSKPAAPIIAQMYNFLNLGFEGYKKIAFKDMRNSRMLSRALESTYFTVIMTTIVLLSRVLNFRVIIRSSATSTAQLALKSAQAPRIERVISTRTTRNSMKQDSPLSPSGIHCIYLFMTTISNLA